MSDNERSRDDLNHQSPDATRYVYGRLAPTVRTPTPYDWERVEGAKTLGDAYRHHSRDPEAFVAGVQYALDSVIREVEFAGGLVDDRFVNTMAVSILRRAKAGEPQ